MQQCSVLWSGKCDREEWAGSDREWRMEFLVPTNHFGVLFDLHHFVLVLWQDESGFDHLHHHTPRTTSNVFYFCFFRENKIKTDCLMGHVENQVEEKKITVKNAKEEIG